MMQEYSANLHHQHHHLLIHASSSSSTSSSSSYAAVAGGTSTTDHAWPQPSAFWNSSDAAAAAAAHQHYFPSRSAGGAFSQIYPSINISNLITTSTNSSSSSTSSSIFGASSYHLDNMDHLLTTDRINLGDLYKLETGLSNFGALHHHPHSLQQYCYSPTPTTTTTTQTSSTDVVAGGKPSCIQPAAPSKKLRLEPRASSCPPFKVRKEKLGDRIAALQQLVAPFGKTDTASVLMEAIGYINFLQNQVQTLSVPYMKPSRNKSSRTKQNGTAADDGNGEAKRDLRSRGLCLVPLSCMSYVASDEGTSGGGVWPPPTYGGRT